MNEICMYVIAILFLKNNDVFNRKYVIIILYIEYIEYKYIQHSIYVINMIISCCMVNNNIIHKVINYLRTYEYYYSKS